MKAEQLERIIQTLIHTNLYVLDKGTKDHPDLIIGGTDDLKRELVNLFFKHGIMQGWPAQDWVNKNVNHFVALYGDAPISKEKANSFGVGFIKCYDLLTKIVCQPPVASEGVGEANMCADFIKNQLKYKTIMSDEKTTTSTNGDYTITFYNINGFMNGNPVVRMDRGLHVPTWFYFIARILFGRF